ncbi:gliding motility-associated C-terminal domain-containing protein [Cytophagaceae bacterium YF14B1]|uniref:Gliding motility-associated C-terminal domain-containing protein n=1 Tax=Xanthocytophaga flava TaxID=3048013 RepID=A0AAE3U8B4_9BACT|nr:gliding motility-associated C-terminal domain-containing protein [Xanthocytophaga flavus]MDJ1482492.1 gliding motility-associated C-terminal domain-containing protein [Xanthocytophaga flavus]
MTNRHIWVLLFWCWSCMLTAQNIPWKVRPTGVNHTIFIKNTIPLTVNGVTLEAGDAIGVFYDSLGVKACGGYIEWQKQPAALTAYGDDGINKGFKTGEVFTFRVWKKSTNCISENVQVTYISGGIISHTNQFAPDGISELSTLQGTASTIRYNSGSFCKDAGLQAPVFTGSVSQVIYTSSEGLTLNESTGVIDVTRSEPGNYTITFSSPVCLTQQQISVSIAPGINLTQLVTTFIDATCEKQKGTLEIDISTITGGTKPYRLALRETSRNETITSVGNRFDNLIPGSYELIVTDALQCQQIASTTINVSTPTDCVPVISPNGDGVADAFYIPSQGVVKIYNRYGQLLKTLSTPSEWDATDESGNLVPMGNYILVGSNAADKKVITVIR